MKPRIWRTITADNRNRKNLQKKPTKKLRIWILRHGMKKIQRKKRRKYCNSFSPGLPLIS